MILHLTSHFITNPIDILISELYGLHPFMIELAMNHLFRTTCKLGG